MKLYAARHGQTEWNSESRVCGISDINLTNKGIEQAKELSTKLIDHQIDIIFSSPLRRAKITAEIISNTIGKDYIIENRLIEQNYGFFEGVPRDMEEFKEAKKHFPSKLLGGESLFQVVHRVYNLIEETKEKYPNNNVMFVTHGSVCRVINAYFNDLSNEEYYKYYTGNCEWSEYNF
jgi:probable phosphoglycerate mutase